jgi:hypothetical protein
VHEKGFVKAYRARACICGHVRSDLLRKLIRSLSEDWIASRLCPEEKPTFVEVLVAQDLWGVDVVGGVWVPPTDQLQSMK